MILFKVATVLIILLFSSNISAQNVDPSDTNWTYHGKTSSEFWGFLKPGYKRCRTGHFQSPIDISTNDAKIANINDKIIVHYTDSQTIAIKNTGYTTQISSNSKSTANIAGIEYNLLQIHFHAQSEHTINGIDTPLEAHFVHQDENGNLAVIGVLIKAGKENKKLRVVTNNLPTDKKKTKLHNISFNAENLLPENKDFYSYLGSLTIPPCTEIVKWYVLKHSVEMSQEQITKITSLHPNSFRPTQKLEGRVVTK